MFAKHSIRLLLRRTIAQIEFRCWKIRQRCCEIACFDWVISLKRHILTLAPEPGLHHIVAARYCGFVREAAALPGRFLPELGRFGNEAAFFLSARIFLVLAVSRLLTCSRTLRGTLLARTKNLARCHACFLSLLLTGQNPSRWRAYYSAANGRERPPRRDGLMAVSFVSTSVSLFFNASKPGLR